MVVSPSVGVVPSRGQAMIRIQFNPDCIFKFDSKIEVRETNGALFMSILTLF